MMMTASLGSYASLPSMSSFLNWSGIMFTEFAKEHLLKEKRLLRLRQIREQETQWARKRIKERYIEVKQKTLDKKVRERKVGFCIFFILE